MQEIKEAEKEIEANGLVIPGSTTSGSNMGSIGKEKDEVV